MAVKQMNDPFTKVSTAVRDALNSFPKQREKVKDALQVTLEVVQIIRDRGAADYEMQLAQIERDCCIFASRVNYIEDRLGRCERLIDAARRVGSTEKLNEALNTFMDWFWLNREFVASFREAEFRWLEQEEEIFAVIGDTYEAE